MDNYYLRQMKSKKISKTKKRWRLMLSIFLAAGLPFLIYYFSLFHAAGLKTQLAPEILGEGVTRVSLTIRETQGVERINHPITQGVPFPKGELTSINNVRILDSNYKEVPCQKQVTATWDKDNSSIKWALLDFPASVSANGSSTYYVEYGSGISSISGGDQVSVSEDSQKITVNTGPLQFSIRKDKFTFIEEANFAGQNLIAANQNQELSLIDQDNITYKSSNIPGDYSVEIEDRGPKRVQIKASGWYVSDSGDKRFKYEVRFNAYAGKPIVRVYHTFVFSEDAFKYKLKNIAIKTPLNLSDNLNYAIGGESGITANPLSSLSGNVHLLQDDYNHYSIKDNAGHFVTEAGKSKGWLDLNDGQKGVTVGIRDMWQSYPLELEAYGKNLIAHLWPLHGDYTAQVQAKKKLVSEKKSTHFWPFHEGNLLDLQAVSPDFNNAGCSTSDPEACLDYDILNNAAGIARTHELVYYFHSGDHSAAGSENTFKAYSKELSAFNPDWTINSGVFGSVIAYEPNLYPDFEAVVEKFFTTFEKMSETHKVYGMLPYGEAYYGSPAAAGAGNRYWIHWRVNWNQLFWLHYARRGNPDWLEKAILTTRHVMDVDVAHLASNFTDVKGNLVKKELGAYPGSHETGTAHWNSDMGYVGTSMDAHPEPLINYYYLTGYKRARDVAVLRGEQTYANGARYDAWPSARDATGALGDPIQMYQLTWDQKYLDFANARMSKILSIKMSKKPDGYWGEHSRNWDIMTTNWLPNEFEDYCRISDNQAAKDEFLQTAKAAGGMGLTNDTSGFRTYGFPLSWHGYAYELSGDSKFLSYGKYYYDLAINNADANFGIYTSSTSPDMHASARFLLRAPRFLKTLKGFGGTPASPSLPSMFVPIGKEGTNKTVFLVKEETDQAISLKIFPQSGTGFFDAWADSGNVYVRIYDPQGNLATSDVFTMPMYYEEQFLNGVDNRIRSYAVPVDGKTGIYTVEVTADDPEHIGKTGGPAVVNLAANSLEKSLVAVPASGIRLDQGRYYFYVSEDTTQFKMHSASWNNFLLFKPDGKLYSNPNWSYTITPADSQKNAFWSIAFTNNDPGFTTVYFDSGLPLYLAPSAAAYFSPEGIPIISDTTAPAVPAGLIVR
jgi:hypothetical protein